MVPALPGLWMQSGLGDGLEMGFRDCSQARVEEEAFFFFFFAFQDIQGTSLTSVGPSLLDSEQGLGLRVFLPKNWPKPRAP